MMLQDWRAPLIAASLALVAGPSAQAQGASLAPPSESFDSMTVTGVVTPVCTLETQIPEVSVIDLQTSAAQPLGDLTYTCNSPAGFTRRIVSQNGGALTNGSDRIPYRIVHGGAAPLALSATSVGGPIATHILPFGSITSGEAGTLSVLAPGSTEGLTAGAYEDTLTVEITAD